MEGKKLKKSIITVLGKDSVGIIAKVCTYLANNNVNILDINQTITGGFADTHCNSTNIKVHLMNHLISFNYFIYV